MARISEMHYSNAYAARSGVDEFLEVALDPSEDAGDFSVSFYNANGSLYLTVPLDDPGVTVTYDADSDENVFVISSSVFNVFLTDPDGGGANNTEAYALTNDDTGEVVDFYDIGGGTQNITAVDGPAAGVTSDNIPTPTGPQSSTYTIQFNKPNTDQVSYAPLSQGDSGLICFAENTRIATPDGWRLVQDLRAGDKIETLDHGAQPLVWVGNRSVRAYGSLAPVVIGKGALGNARDLVVSPQHRMLLNGWRAEMLFAEDEVLIAAKHLVDSDRVYIRSGGRVTYHHLLFEAHEIIFAEGVPTESFHPGEYALGVMPEDTRAEIVALFPELAVDADAYGAPARRGLTAPEAAAFEALAL